MKLHPSRPITNQHLDPLLATNNKVVKVYFVVVAVGVPPQILS